MDFFRRDWSLQETFSAPVHGGTHLDAPYELVKDGWTVTDIPLERLIFVPVAVVDVSNDVSHQPGYEVTVADLLRWEQGHGALPPNSLVIVHTGWSRVSISLIKLV